MTPTSPTTFVHHVIVNGNNGGPFSIQVVRPCSEVPLISLLIGGERPILSDLTREGVQSLVSILQETLEYLDGQTESLRLTCPPPPNPSTPTEPAVNG